MDLLLLAIRTSRPIFVREGGGEGWRSAIAILRDRCKVNGRLLLHFLRLRALFKSEASL